MRAEVSRVQAHRAEIRNSVLQESNLCFMSQDLSEKNNMGYHLHLRDMGLMSDLTCDPGQVPTVDLFSFVGGLAQ